MTIVAVAAGPEIWEVVGSEVKINNLHALFLFCCTLIDGSVAVERKVEPGGAPVLVDHLFRQNTKVKREGNGGAYFTWY